MTAFAVCEMNQEFYKTKKWRKKSKDILKRDKFRCQYCKRYGKIREAVLVHHIKHLEEFPELAYNNENLISLCLECHNKEHPERAKPPYLLRY